MKRLRIGDTVGSSARATGAVSISRLAVLPKTFDWKRIASSPLALPLILIMTFAVFAPTLQTWFQGDDFWLLRSAGATPTGKFILQAAFDYRDTRPVPEFPFYRPLYIITFKFCYMAFGLNPTGYHLLAIALHLASVALVWVITRRLLKFVAAANFAALLFALHPAYTETVQWIARGNTLMLTLVYLLTMLSFMNYMDGGSRRRLYYIGSVVGFAAAVLYHTTALSLVAVLPAYAFLIVGPPSAALRWRSWLRFTPFLAITAIMAYIQHRVGLGDMFQLGTFQYTSYGQYLGMALFPIFPQDWLQLPVSGLNILSHLYMAASLVMIAAALMLFDRRQPPYIGVFALVWLLAMLAPNTTFVFLVDPLTGIIPPQLYLPGTSLGLFFVVVGKEAHEMLSPALARQAARCLPFLLVGVFAAYAALSLIHERRDIRIANESRTFVSQLQDALPPPAPGSMLYVADAPLNLVVLSDVALIAAVQVYYGDVHVVQVTVEQAAYIKAADPSQLVFVYQP